MSGLLSILLAATIPLRNPFWPVGYHGTLEPISDAANIHAVEQPTEEEETRTSAAAAEALAAAAAAHDEDDAVEMERRWVRARKSLRVMGTMKVGGEVNPRQAVGINGNIYGDGDLVSINHDGYRFTWRVRALTKNKTLQLIRVRARELELDLMPDLSKSNGKNESKEKDKKGKSK